MRTFDAKTDVSVILTHIGTNDFPAYIYDCIEQIRLFNKLVPIYMAVNKKVNKIDLARLDYLRCNVVYIEDLSQTLEHKTFKKRTRLKSFWRVTMERFFVVEEVMREKKLEKALHLENDNLIYFDINEVFPLISSNFSGLAMPSDNETRCIAGVVFIDNVNLLNSLNLFLATISPKRSVNEMQCLREFMEKEKAKFLPVITKDYSGPWKLDEVSKEAYSYCSQLFHGVFDAAAIGQYMGGKDKRSYKDIMKGSFESLQQVGIVPLINQDALYQYDHTNIEWLNNENGLITPNFKDGDNGYRIYNLHIHSKELYRFKSNRVYM